ncbi:MAG: hypothetical protein ACKN9V_06340 [Pseudomonadota bacterium]
MSQPLFILLMFGLAACSSLDPTLSSDPWLRGEKKPTRAIVLLANNLDPDSTDFTVLPNFQRLRRHCLNFNQAWLGHLFPTPSVSSMVLTTGLNPKHLPWDDIQFFDKSGILGKKNKAHDISQLSSSELSKILSGVRSSILNKIPGSPDSKLVIAPKTDEAFSLAIPTTQSRILSGTPAPSQSPEAWVTDGVLSFFNMEPHWKLVLAAFGNRGSQFASLDEQLGRILDYLERKQLIRETAIILTSHPNHVPEKVKRFYLAKKDLKYILKFTSQLKNKPHIFEIYYKKEISGRFHYIRTFRSPNVEGSRLEWTKNQMPTLLNSLANEHSAEVLAFLDEAPQKIPLLIWAPNLRADNPVIKNQMEQTRVQFVDIHPILLETLGLIPDPSLDGSSLGINSLIY